MASAPNLSKISDHAQAEAQVTQFREFVMQYNKLGEKCFTDCIWDFSSRFIQNREINCVLNCVTKFTQVTQRISERFQEIQMLSNENAVAAAQKLGKVGGV